MAEGESVLNTGSAPSESDQPVQPIDVGTELAQAREQRAMSLADISRRTRIGMPALRAIERNDAGALPGGIYTRGMLRAYAREVGCDPEAIVTRFREQCDTHDSNANIDVAIGAERRRPPEPLHSADIDAMDRRNMYLQIGVWLLLLFGGSAYVWAGRDLHLIRTQSSQLAGAPLPSRPTPDAVLRIEGTSGFLEAARASEEVSSSLKIDIQPTGTCWVTATADGERVVNRLLNSGDRTSVEAHSEVLLRVGDAAAFAFTINGVAGRSLGTAGQPVTVHLTPQNYRTFLNP